MGKHRIKASHAGHWDTWHVLVVPFGVGRLFHGHAMANFHNGTGRSVFSQTSREMGIRIGETAV
ncbi:unnamed protein product, partial [Nesidiocoris tenuis]